MHKMRKLVWIIALQCLFTSLHATGSDISRKDLPFQPWYTGPIIASTAINVSPGMFNMQPYVYLQNTYAEYNHAGHQRKIQGNEGLLQFFNLAKAGITKFLDITMTNNLYYNKSGGESSWNYGDMSVRLGFQLLKGHPKWYIPDMRLVVSESFPSGSYQKLNPNKNGTDGVGSGAYDSQISLNMQFYVYQFKIWPTAGYHPTRFRFSFSYAIPSNVSVEGFNVYGGGFGTSGTVSPGNTFNFVGAFEYSLTQRWVIASDLQITDVQKATFKGNAGSNLGGGGASMGSPSSDSITITPSIEYNINDNFGFIGGVWLPIWGRNSSVFINYVLSFTYTF